MSNISTYARPALDGWTQTGRIGAKDGSCGLTVTIRSDAGVATVIASRRAGLRIEDVMREQYGIELPHRPRFVTGSEVEIVGIGQGQWLALSDVYRNGDLCRHLKQKLSGLAAISDQSDGRVIFRLQGARVREVLSKGVPIDLHAQAFGPGDAVSTTVRHVGVQLWQIDGEPTYEFAIFRSYAVSFWRWIVDTSAQVGCQVNC